MNDVTTKINKLREEVERLESEIREFELQNSNYYIGVCAIGDGDYWDEYYHRLGLTNKNDTWMFTAQDILKLLRKFMISFGIGSVLINYE